jgi:hypothetical protein
MANWLDRHWRLAVLLFWIAACALLLYTRWRGIYWFALPDTDDNLRMAQVRALLDGQGWYDLRQYRFDPPGGADIHWSRLVDLPIAGIILLMQPLFGGAMAEKIAVGAAPLLPMLVAMFAIAATARRLLSPCAFTLALALLMCAHGARFMWSPLRIDHHGWQLAMLSLVMLSFAVRRPLPGGLLLGGASAVSLAIGLETLVYLALAGGLTVLLWVRNPDARPRLFGYGASLAGGTSLGYLLFASWANQAPVCDALSPVWLSAMVGAGAFCVAMASVNIASRAKRLGAAAVAGLLIAGAFAWFWPDCLSRPEGVSAELYDLWLQHVREARSILLRDGDSIVTILALPVAGLIGYGVMLWRHRKDPQRFTGWAALGIMCLAATGLVLWQTRAGASAQLLAVPGATGIAWLAAGWVMRQTSPVIRVGGIVAAFLLISGFGPQVIAGFAFKRAPNAVLNKVASAGRTCPTLPALKPVALQPKGLVLTFVDLGPRLIAVTHHDAVAGPYHRNGDDIIDVMRTFRGSAEDAERMVRKRKIDYVLVCLNLSESTIYRSYAPKGFYVQLASGQVPSWLEPVVLPADSPYRMWRVMPY